MGKDLDLPFWGGSSYERSQPRVFEAFIQSIESNSSNPFDDVRKEGKALGLETEKLAFSKTIQNRQHEGKMKYQNRRNHLS